MGGTEGGTEGVDGGTEGVDGGREGGSGGREGGGIGLHWVGLEGSFWLTGSHWDCSLN